MIRVLRPLSRLSDLFSSLATTLMMLHILLGVIMRVVFHTPLLGTNVIVAYCYMTILVFLGVFVVSSRNEQIRADVVANMFPAPVRRVTDFMSEIITLLFLSALAWGLADAALQKTHIHAQVDAVFGYITVWPLYWITAVGIGLAAVTVVWRVVRTARGQSPTYFADEQVELADWERDA